MALTMEHDPHFGTKLELNCIRKRLLGRITYLEKYHCNAANTNTQIQSTRF